jgi:hypothetical protein
MAADAAAHTDEQRLAELGYKQDLNRAWSSFSNFAISFTIISVLAGCFTTYYIARGRHLLVGVRAGRRKGDAWKPGPWTLGKHYKWINPSAVALVIFMTIDFCLPQAPAAVPWRHEFDWKYFNYAPVTVGGVFLIVGIWWLVSARHKFTGPIRNIDLGDPGTAQAPAPAGD